MLLRTAAVAASVIVIGGVLLDAFEVIVLPRRVTRHLRPARLFYAVTWAPWAKLSRAIPSGRNREAFLSVYGPLSLIFLIAWWAVSLIAGFALLMWGVQTGLHGPPGARVFGDYLYLSGSNFFTLGIGDLHPTDTAGRIVAVVESGTGFGFIALVIGYLPVIYQSFSRRELNITLLDARAGSPPSAAELLRRYGSRNMDELERLLEEWEKWSSDLLESHLSYPVIAYFRSQHSNQSWLAALTTILDTCSVLLAGVRGSPTRQAELTFAMARHAIVDLAQVFRRRPSHTPGRLSAREMQVLSETLRRAGFALRDEARFEGHLAGLRGMYEPYVDALSRYLLLPLPPWAPAKPVVDNWRTSAWEGTLRKLDQLGLPDDDY